MKKQTKNDDYGFELAEQASSKTNCNKRAVGASLEFKIGGVTRSWAMSYNRHIKNSCECVSGVHDLLVDHAEKNITDSLMTKSRNKRSFQGQELILRVTYQPCLKCCIEIVKNGIHVVYFRDPKPEDKSGIEYLKKHNVKVINKWY